MNDQPPRQPPRFVPTLTEVIEAIESPPADDAPPAEGARVPLSEDQLVQRVMRRVSQGLEQRLREAVAQVVLEQTRAIAPLVAAEVETAVRALVAEALDAERGH